MPQAITGTWTRILSHFSVYCFESRTRGTFSLCLRKMHSHLFPFHSRNEEVEEAGSGLPSWFLELVPSIKFDINNVSSHGMNHYYSRYGYSLVFK